ncbi:hypothetical protein AA0112_g12691 [Alternaria arborescens]|nr:hypothetical protein AA0112_g12691 [Alternaria arborescens]
MSALASEDVRLCRTGCGKPGLSLGCLAPPVGKAEARNQAHDSTWLGTQDAEGEGLSMAAGAFCDGLYELVTNCPE